MSITDSTINQLQQLLKSNHTDLGSLLSALYDRVFCESPDVECLGWITKVESAAASLNHQSLDGTEYIQILNPIQDGPGKPTSHLEMLSKLQKRIPDDYLLTEDPKKLTITGDNQTDMAFAQYHHAAQDTCTKTVKVIEDTLEEIRKYQDASRLEPLSWLEQSDSGEIVAIFTNGHRAQTQAADKVNQLKGSLSFLSAFGAEAMMSMGNIASLGISHLQGTMNKHRCALEKDTTASPEGGDDASQLSFYDAYAKAAHIAWRQLETQKAISEALTQCGRPCYPDAVVTRRRIADCLATKLAAEAEKDRREGLITNRLSSRVEIGSFGDLTSCMAGLRIGGLYYEKDTPSRHDFCIGDSSKGAYKLERIPNGFARVYWVEGDTYLPLDPPNPLFVFAYDRDTKQYVITCGIRSLAKNYNIEDPSGLEIHHEWLLDCHSKDNTYQVPDASDWTDAMVHYFRGTLPSVLHTITQVFKRTYEAYRDEYTRLQNELDRARQLDDKAALSLAKERLNMHGSQDTDLNALVNRHTSTMLVNIQEWYSRSLTLQGQCSGFPSINDDRIRSVGFKLAAEQMIRSLPQQVQNSIMGGNTKLHTKDPATPSGSNRTLETSF